MAATISASVGKDARNAVADVKTVQSLLNRVPVQQGGPSVPLKVDGLCYGKTLASIQSFQRKSCAFQNPDQRIDPGGPTWTRLSKYDAHETSNVIHCYPVDTRWHMADTRSFMSQSLPLTEASLVDAARSRLRIATQWVSATLTTLAVVRSMVQRYHAYTPDEQVVFGPIETHFKVGITSVSETETNHRLGKITAVYSRIQQALGQMMTGRLRGDPSAPDKASAPLGGFDVPDAAITIGSDFINCNTNMQAAVLIHECAHFVDAACSHAASELPPPNGSPITDQFGKAVNPRAKNYAQLDFDVAIRNAYSFAQCAMHNGLGFDRRPP